MKKNKDVPLRALVVYPVEVVLSPRTNESLDAVWARCIAEADVLMKSNQVAPVIINSNLAGLCEKKTNKQFALESQADFYQVILETFNQVEESLALIQRLNSFLKPNLRDNLFAIQNDIKKLLKEFLGVREAEQEDR